MTGVIYENMIDMSAERALIRCKLIDAPEDTVNWERFLPALKSVCYGEQCGGGKRRVRRPKAARRYLLLVLPPKRYIHAISISQAYFEHMPGVSIASILTFLYEGPKKTCL